MRGIDKSIRAAVVDVRILNVIRLLDEYSTITRLMFSLVKVRTLPCTCLPSTAGGWRTICTPPPSLTLATDTLAVCSFCHGLQDDENDISISIDLLYLSILDSSRTQVDSWWPAETSGWFDESKRHVFWHCSILFILESSKRPFSVYFSCAISGRSYQHNRQRVSTEGRWLWQPWCWFFITSQPNRKERPASTKTTQSTATGTVGRRGCGCRVCKIKSLLSSFRPKLRFASSNADMHARPL